MMAGQAGPLFRDRETWLGEIKQKLETLGTSFLANKKYHVAIPEERRNQKFLIQLQLLKRSGIEILSEDLSVLDKLDFKTEIYKIRALNKIASRLKMGGNVKPDEFNPEERTALEIMKIDINAIQLSKREEEPPMVIDSGPQYTPKSDEDENDDYKKRSARLEAKGNSKKYEGKYYEQDDIFSDQKSLEQRVYGHFLTWDFELIRPAKVLGFGRTGYVTLGRAWQIGDSENKIDVAVKMADYLKKRPLLEEMQNEARVMAYANNRGLKCVPKLLWSGFFGFGGELYVNCTQRVIGYKRDFNKLTKREKRMLRDSLKELRTANIFHHDLKKNNILFGEKNCFIIDYGSAQIAKEETFLELELNIDDVKERKKEERLIE